MILTPAQTKIQRDIHRFKVINCGRRFGKTTLAVNAIALKIAGGKKKVAYIAPTYQQARDIAWEMLKKVFIGAQFNGSRLEVKIGDMTIFVRGWEAIETLRGQSFDFIVIDEVAMMRNFWVNWEEVIRPTLTDTKGEVMFISTPKGFNHFYDLFNKVDPDYKSFHFTSYDNPHLPVEELNKAKEEIPEDRFAQEYLADFRKTEGLVFKDFDRTRDVTTTFPKTYSDTIAGEDFGWQNPACVLPIGIDGDEHYWIRREWYFSHKTTEELIEYALTTKATKHYPDPENAEAVEKCRRAGLNVRLPVKDIVIVTDHLIELFKQHRIHIHPDCKNLIWELETYHYPESKNDRNESEKPVDKDNHAIKSLGYALYTNKPKINEPRDPIIERFGTYYID